MDRTSIVDMPLETLYNIFNNVDCASVIRFCSINTEYKDLLCDNENFWNQYLKYRGYGDSIIPDMTNADYRNICKFKESSKRIERYVSRQIGFLDKITKTSVSGIKNIKSVVSRTFGVIGNNNGVYEGRNIEFTIFLTESGEIYSYCRSGDITGEETISPIIVKDETNQIILGEMPLFKWITDTYACDTNNRLYYLMDRNELDGSPFVQSKEDPSDISLIYERSPKGTVAPNFVKVHGYPRGTIFIDKDGYYYLYGVFEGVIKGPQLTNINNTITLIEDDGTITENNQFMRIKNSNNFKDMIIIGKSDYSQLIALTYDGIILQYKYTYDAIDLIRHMGNVIEISSEQDVIEIDIFSQTNIQDDVVDMIIFPSPIHKIAHSISSFTDDELFLTVLDTTGRVLRNIRRVEAGRTHATVSYIATMNLYNDPRGHYFIGDHIVTIGDINTTKRIDKFYGNFNKGKGNILYITLQGLCVIVERKGTGFISETLDTNVSDIIYNRITTNCYPISRWIEYLKTQD